MGTGFHWLLLYSVRPFPLGLLRVTGTLALILLMTYANQDATGNRTGCPRSIPPQSLAIHTATHIAR